MLVNATEMLINSFYQVVTQEQQTARSAYPCGMEKL